MSSARIEIRNILQPEFKKCRGLLQWQKLKEENRLLNLLPYFLREGVGGREANLLSGGYEQVYDVLMKGVRV